jgi:NAD(P)-dependent dehydrogenase (short-subunit alcohol dehydrogenase family)
MYLSLAAEVRRHNIAVNLLSPGRVDTWMSRNGDCPGTAYILMVPPDDVIPAAVWLARRTAEIFFGQLVEQADFGVARGDLPQISA